MSRASIIVFNISICFKSPTIIKELVSFEAVIEGGFLGYFTFTICFNTFSTFETSEFLRVITFVI